jgi:hypothetical protein
MKSRLIPSLARWSFLLLALCRSVLAQVPRQVFKAGAYRGTLQVSISLPDIAPTTTTARVNGRSNGDTTLQFIAPPQIAQPLIGGSSDDYPAKIFSLVYMNTGDRMGLSEVANTDTAGGAVVTSLQSLQIAGNLVKAEVAREFMLNGQTVTMTIRVRLTRVGK